jgi:hypothetical protein
VSLIACDVAVVRIRFGFMSDFRGGVSGEQRKCMSRDHGMKL